MKRYLQKKIIGAVTLKRLLLLLFIYELKFTYPKHQSQTHSLNLQISE